MTKHTDEELNTTQAAVERLQARIHKHTDTSEPNIVVGDLRTLLADNTRQAERIKELETLSTPFARELTVFAADLDEGDNEEIEIYVTRRDVKRLRAALGLDPIMDATPPAAPSLPADVVALVEAAREGLICAEADLETQRQSCIEEGEEPEQDQLYQVFKARRDLIATALDPFADRVAGEPVTSIEVEFDRTTGNLKHPTPPPAVVEQTDREG